VGAHTQKRKQGAGRMHGEGKREEGGAVASQLFDKYYSCKTGLLPGTVKIS
jgi:hypothetical protein